jgi:hypothetical protein
MKARMETNATTNDEKFHLYGDPSMRLAIPRYTAQLATPDTIKALAVMRVRGTVLQNGQQALNYNGKVRLEAFDTQHRVSYRSPGNFNIFYDLPGNSLFRGEAPVTNGNFEVQFIAPKDLTYGGTNGRFTVYFWNDSTDGNGYRENLLVGGSAASVVDATGPEIQIGFQGVENFVSGRYVAPQPVLHVVLKDSISGINIAGEIGHKITLTLDGNTGNKIDVTDLFSYESGSFTRGALFYQLDGLGEGRHTLEVKAWDNSNNSGTASAEFVIADQGQLALREVMNYPNPLRNETSFTFEINQPTATVEIKIYTLAGRLIRRLEPVEAVSGFNMIPWDGRDGDGDQLANGVYLYKVVASMKSAENGGDLRAEEIGKVVVQR